MWTAGPERPGDRVALKHKAVSLTGGPHLDPVVLVCLADDMLSPDAEAVVPGVPEDVGQVVGRAGHGHGVTLPFFQREALGLQAPAHGQRGGCGEMRAVARAGSVGGVDTDQVQERPGGYELRCPPQERPPCAFQTGAEKSI